MYLGGVGVGRVPRGVGRGPPPPPQALALWRWLAQPPFKEAAPRKALELLTEHMAAQHEHSREAPEEKVPPLPKGTGGGPQVTK